jgi:hypothetical protein
MASSADGPSGSSTAMARRDAASADERASPEHGLGRRIGQDHGAVVSKNHDTIVTMLDDAFDLDRGQGFHSVLPEGSFLASAGCKVRTGGDRAATPCGSE